MRPSGVGPWIDAAAADEVVGRDVAEEGASLVIGAGRTRYEGRKAVRHQVAKLERSHAATGTPIENLQAVGSLAGSDLVERTALVAGTVDARDPIDEIGRVGVVEERVVEIVMRPARRP